MVIDKAKPACRDGASRFRYSIKRCDYSTADRAEPYCLLPLNTPKPLSLHLLVLQLVNTLEIEAILHLLCTMIYLNKLLLIVR